MKQIIAVFSFCLIRFSAFGHGEDKPGPNSGYIRMPGAFHTELVPEGATKFKIYLLDMEWKNPSVTNSKLEIKFNTPKKSASVNCSQTENYYLCELPKGLSLKKGKLTVNSSREGLVGNEVIYGLPLSFKGHHGH